MCGICGVYEYRRGEPVPETVVSSMLDTIVHRGPDDDGLLLDRDLAVGMRRLSIIDLAGGKQPISNEDGSVTVLFNGEIYNYVELAEQLRARGHRLATASDTEVIVHLYEELGDDCVHELRGMFAFALWDSRRRRLLAVRDRLGIKPLYYTLVGDRLVFASEIKSILRHPFVEAVPNLQALSNYLSLKYVPAPQTMFEGIEALPPGCLLVCDSDGVSTRRYWDLSFARAGADGRSEESYAEELDAILRESVRLELRSDVPFGAFLSGGIDSSTIVALMSEFLDEPVKTFSVGFEGAGAEVSELPFARMVAERYQTDHHEVIVTPRHLIDQAEKVVWHLDQPIADDACLANYLLSDLASKQVKMVLTGEGGDELFAGYARYAGERFSAIFRRIPRPARSAMLAASRRIPGFQRPKIALYAWSQEDEVARLTNWFPLFNAERKAQLLSDELKRELVDISANYVFAEQLARTDAVEPLNRMLYVDTKLWLPDDLLARGDKTSMAASLEARVPLLDHKLVEFAATLPTHLKLKGLTRKYLLRKVARRLLPREILERPKKGFPMPFSAWFRGDARTFVRDLLSPSTVRRRGLFSPTYVQKLLDDNDRGLAQNGSLLWGLMSVELWYRQFIDGEGPARHGGEHDQLAVRATRRG
jgi:asparagine synthase (glutamine-hydrolysing)